MISGFSLLATIASDQSPDVGISSPDSALSCTQIASRGKRRLRARNYTFIRRFVSSCRSELFSGSTITNEITCAVSIAKSRTNVALRLPRRPIYQRAGQKMADLPRLPMKLLLITDQLVQFQANLRCSGEAV